MTGSLTTNPVFGSPWTWIAVLLTAVVVVADGLRVMRSGSGRTVLSGVFRFIALVSLAVLLFQPSFTRRIRTRERRTVAFLLDRSASMSARDGVGGGDRVSEVSTFFERYGPKIQELRSSYDIRLFGFGEHVDELLSPDAAAAETLTALGDAVQMVDSRTRKEPNGKPLHSIVLISDGRSNCGHDPLLAAGALARKAVVMHTVLAGTTERFRDAAVIELASTSRRWQIVPGRERESPESRVYLRKKFGVRVRVRARRVQGEKISIELEADGCEMQEKTIEPVREDEVLTASFDVVPERLGPMRLCARVTTSDAPDAVPDNNELSALVEVIPGSLGITYIEGVLSWDYRLVVSALSAVPHGKLNVVRAFVKGSHAYEPPAHTALEETGREVTVVGHIPPDRLREHDVTRPEHVWKVLNAGGGLVVMGGEACAPGSALSPWLPFERKSKETAKDRKDLRPARVRLTPFGRAASCCISAGGNEEWRALPPIVPLEVPGKLHPRADVLIETVDANPVVVTWRPESTPRGRVCVVLVQNISPWSLGKKGRRDFVERFLRGLVRYAAGEERAEETEGETGKAATTNTALELELLDCEPDPLLMRELAASTGGIPVTVSDADRIFERLEGDAVRGEVEIETRHEAGLWTWGAMAVFALALFAAWQAALPRPVAGSRPPYQERESSTRPPPQA